jgi:ceramide synthetase
MVLSHFIYKPFVRKVNMDEESAQKFPESAFKVLYYSVSWVYCFYLVIIKYEFFQQPGDVWMGWKLGASVPDDVYIVYVFQLGLYFHGLYATCFMDDVRRDYYMMIIHHLLTIALIGFSLNVRYHNIGLLVIFLHDLNDVLLDGSKCLLYMKNRDGKEYPQWDTAATVGFTIFSIVW